MRRTLPVVMLCLAAMISGCGGDDEDKSADPQVRAVITNLTDASRAGDAGKICDEIFAPQLKDSVAKAAGRPCAKEVKKKLFSPNATFTIEQLGVSGKTATVTVVDQFQKKSLIALVKLNNQWSIVGVTKAG
jgi:hypothetical protein